MEQFKVKLFVTILDTFSMDNGKSYLNEEKIHSNKITKLLMYLFLHHNRAVTKKELSEAIFRKSPEEASGVLKNLIYRTRTLLGSFDGPEVIQTVNEGYRVNPEYSVMTDLELFENAARQLTDCSMEDPKIETQGKELLMRYAGTISQKVGHEPWMLSVEQHFLERYLEVAKVLGEYYQKHARWEELECLCQQILMKSPLEDEFNVWMIFALDGQHKVVEVLEFFEKTRKLYYSALGVRKPQKLMDAFDEIMVTDHIDGSNIMDVIDELAEAEVEIGAYYCDYQMFRQIYLVERRRAHGEEAKSWLLVLSVKYRSKELNADIRYDKWFLSKVEVLEGILKRYLRAGDIVTRYNLFQYVLIIPGCSDENIEKVIERIKNLFTQDVGRTILTIDVEKAAILSDRDAGGVPAQTQSAPA